MQFYLPVIRDLPVRDVGDFIEIPLSLLKLRDPISHMPLDGQIPRTVRRINKLAYEFA